MSCCLLRQRSGTALAESELPLGLGHIRQSQMTLLRRNAEIRPPGSNGPQNRNKDTILTTIIATMEGNGAGSATGGCSATVTTQAQAHPYAWTLSLCIT